MGRSNQVPNGYFNRTRNKPTDYRGTLSINRDLGVWVEEETVFREGHVLDEKGSILLNLARNEVALEREKEERYTNTSLAYFFL